MKEELRKKGERLDPEDEELYKALDLWDEQRLIQENMSKDFQTQSSQSDNTPESGTTFNDKFKQNQGKE